jgi:hypothetical protein
MKLITSQMASNFAFNELNENSLYDFQHLTPASHKEFSKSKYGVYRFNGT